MTRDPYEGWHRPSNSRKWHYYRDMRSLCGATLFGYGGDFAVGDNESPDNCVACKKKLRSRLR